MVDIGKIKIKKKIYRFDIKKRSHYVKHYKAKERPPIERIKDALKKVFVPKKVEAQKRREKAPEKVPPGGFNFAVFGAAILIAVIILALGYVYWSTQLQLQAGVFQPPVEKPSMENALLGGTVLNSGTMGEPRFTAAVMVDYNIKNLKNYTIELTPYEGIVPSEVFILNSDRYEATTYSEFVNALRMNLSKRKVTLNEMNLKQLETLPQGAMVIVPSGYIPQEFMGFGSSINLEKLVAERGIVIVYVGLPFTKMLNVTPTSTPQDAIANLPFSFDERTVLETEPDFNLYQPRYRVAGRKGWGTQLVYGSVSVLKKNNGAIVFLPQTLDGGWRKDYGLAASDISRIIFEIPWAKSIGQTKTYVIHTNETNQTSSADTAHFFSEAFDTPNATIKVDFTGNSETFSIHETLFAYAFSDLNSQLFIEAGEDVEVVPTNISNELVRINARLKEPSPAQPSMLLVIGDIHGNYLQTFHQGAISVQADKSFDVPIYVDRGEYFVQLIDDESKLYAQAYMEVVSIDITRKGSKGAVYSFDVSTPLPLREVTVTVNGGQHGTYTVHDVVSTIDVDISDYTGGEPLPYGDHVFSFSSGGLSVDVPWKLVRVRTFLDDPLFWGVLILTGGVLGIGVIFARQESIFYSVDIPDFPPVARTKVPLSPDVILSIFEKVNENYRWEHTPLTTTEIKNGFKDIFYKGRPVYITDYNVEYLLEELGKRGSVKESLGYYGLAVWEGKVKYSMDYISLMRKLRDICVNNAVPFTSMGKSKEADSIITVVGQQMFIHFYTTVRDPKKLLTKVLPTIASGITILLFKNEMEKDAFMTLLSSSPNAAPLILKMETDSKSLLLLTTEEFEDMLKEFKSM